MNFFERQAAARRTSRHWIILFVTAVVAIVAAVDAVVITALAVYRQQDAPRYGEVLASGDSRGPLIWTTLIVLSIIAIASLYKSTALRAGGSAVALAAGGRR